MALDPWMTLPMTLAVCYGPGGFKVVLRQTLVHVTRIWDRRGLVGHFVAKYSCDNVAASDKSKKAGVNFEFNKRSVEFAARWGP